MPVEESNYKRLTALIDKMNKEIDATKQEINKELDALKKQLTDLRDSATLTLIDFERFDGILQDRKDKLDSLEAAMKKEGFEDGE